MTQSIKKISGIGSIALVALMVLALPLSFAKADGFDGGFDTIDTSYGADFGGGYDTYDTSYPSNYGYDTIDTSYPYSNGYDTVDTSYPSYGSTGYSTGGYSTGGYSTGGGYMIGTPAYHTPVVVPSAPSNTTVTTNNNTCTNNSCNHDDHSVVNIQNPAPVINNNNVVANYAPTPAPSYPTQQYCPVGYYGTYPNCYRQMAQVVAYGSAPYVSLSQVPYTGLDLGFWGTIAYWGFMVAFALFAAYLIAVKRVQNSIANWLKEFLFGTDEVAAPAQRQTSFSTVVTAPAAPAPHNSDAIDPFILSQINRRTA